MLALPQAAFFLLAEAAVGGTIALFWVHLRGEVNRGFTLFTGVSLLIVEVLAIWLRSAFPPPLAIDRTAALWLDAERVLSLAFAIALGVYLIGLRAERWRRFTAAVAPLVPLLGLVGRDLRRRHHGGDVAHGEDVARPGLRQDAGIDAGVGAADDQNLG